MSKTEKYSQHGRISKSGLDGTQRGQKVLKYTQKRVFCNIPFSLQSMRCGSVLWVSKVSRGHLGRVSMRFCEGLTIFWWILSEKPGFQEYLKWHYLRSKIVKISKIKKVAKKLPMGSKDPRKVFGAYRGCFWALGVDFWQLFWKVDFFGFWDFFRIPDF